MGDQGNGWAEMFRSTFQPHLRHVKFVAPNAREVGGMTAWFEYNGQDPTAPEDLEGLEAVKNYAHQLIDYEVSNGIPQSRIFLGGFSQGGPVALYSGLSYPEHLGGIICLLSSANADIPIFIGHGHEDPNVPYTVAVMTVNALRRFNANVMFRSYPMGHSNCPAELNDVVQFIQTIAPSE